MYTWQTVTSQRAQALVVLTHTRVCVCGRFAWGLVLGSVGSKFTNSHLCPWLWPRNAVTSWRQDLPATINQLKPSLKIHGNHGPSQFVDIQGEQSFEWNCLCFSHISFHFKVWSTGIFSFCENFDCCLRQRIMSTRRDAIAVASLQRCTVLPLKLLKPAELGCFLLTFLGHFRMRPTPIKHYNLIRKTRRFCPVSTTLTGKMCWYSKNYAPGAFPPRMRKQSILQK